MELLLLKLELTLEVELELELALEVELLLELVLEVEAELKLLLLLFVPELTAEPEPPLQAASKSIADNKLILLNIERIRATLHIFVI